MGFLRQLFATESDRTTESISSSPEPPTSAADDDIVISVPVMPGIDRGLHVQRLTDPDHEESRSQVYE